MLQELQWLQYPIDQRSSIWCGRIADASHCSSRLPTALPGILRAPIGIARAAGETAPLLMIGMTFIVDVPSKITDKATVLPAQIYMWANNPERSFEYLTSAAILILLVILIMMNLLAIHQKKI